MFKRIVCILFFALIFSPLFSQQKIKVDLKQAKHKTKNTEIIQRISTGLILSETISSFELLEKETKEGLFCQLISEGLSKTFDEGKPDLLVINRLIEIPFNSEAKIKVLSYDEEIIELKDRGISNLIIPAQVSHEKSKDLKDIPFVKDQLIYNKNDFFKKDIIKFEDKGYLRDKHLGYIEISPFAYNPVTNTLKVLNNIEIEISFIPKDNIKSQNMDKLISPYFENVSLNTLNESEVSKALITGPVKYVIVSDPMFKETLQPFVEWKTKKGFNVIQAYTDVIGITTNDIKNYLKDLYDNPNDGVSPTFVLLVGDVAQIPTFSGTAGEHKTDLYYCEYTGDKLPEVFYGRFSAETIEELQPQIDKTLEIEKYEMPDPSYLGNVILVAGVDGSYASTYGNGAINYANDYYTNTDNGVTSFYYLYNDASGVMASNNTEASASIRSYISSGVSFANYTAHCGSGGWSDPSFNISHIDGLSNEHRYPLIIGNCCQSNTFYDNDCFGEEMLMAADKGAVGYIGGSNLTYWDEDFYWGVGLVSTITADPTYENSGLGAYDRFFHLNGEAKQDWYITQGQINVAGNLAVEASTSSRKDYYWEIYHLMGDPSLTPYVSVPEVIIASYSPGIVTGSTVFQVSAEEDAYVAISRDGVLLDARMVDATGDVELSFNSIEVPGMLDFVITRQNRQPIIDQIAVLSATTPYVVLDYYIIDDLSENNNSEIDFGESVKLDIQLKNLSDIYDAYHVIANLSSTDTNIIISDYTQDFGTILKSDSALIEASFIVDFKNKFADQQKISLSLEILADNAGIEEYAWNSKIKLTVNAPEIEIGDLLINDSSGNNDGIFDPGETVEISLIVSNIGNSAISNLNGIASIFGVDGDYVTLNNEETGSFYLNALDTDTIKFNASADAGTAIGTIISISFEVEDVLYNYYSKSVNKDLSIGEIPEIFISDEDPIIESDIYFYDSGGKDVNYSNSENNTITFYPKNPRGKLEAVFYSFDVEPNGSGCWDYLEIYDGDSINNEFIGSYCGTNLPPTIVAANEGGSLTFKFYSDESISHSGWKAKISNTGYLVKFVVTDINGIVENACVEFNYEEKNTNSQGEVIFNYVTPGENLEYIVRKLNHDNFTGSIRVNENVTEPVFLKEGIATFNVNFTITDGKNLLPNTNINFSDQDVVTNLKGEYTFENLEYSSNEKYIITKDGYYDFIDSVNIIENINLEINLKIKTYNVTIDVIDSSLQVIENVLVIFNGDSSYTDINGEAFFTEIIPGKSLEFTLRKEGFKDYDSSLNVINTDVVFHARLLRITGVVNGELKNDEVKIYPNPSDGLFNLEILSNGNRIYYIKVYDIIGSIVYINKIIGTSFIKEQIDISQKAKGMYFLSIESDNGIVISKRIIIK